MEISELKKQIFETTDIVPVTATYYCIDNNDRRVHLFILEEGLRFPLIHWDETPRCKWKYHNSYAYSFAEHGYPYILKTHKENDVCGASGVWAVKYKTEDGYYKYDRCVNIVKGAILPKYEKEHDKQEWVFCSNMFTEKFGTIYPLLKEELIESTAESIAGHVKEKVFNKVYMFDGEKRDDYPGYNEINEKLRKDLIKVLQNYNNELLSKSNFIQERLL